MPVVAAKPARLLHHAGGWFRSPSQRDVVYGLLLVAVTLALYNPAAKNGFVNFDDDRYVIGNPHVRTGLGWSTVAWAFTSLDQANWHPLTWLSHALDCELFHLNPAGHHYTSVLLHTANGLLLFLILEWFTGYAGRSLMVAALFAVHPLNVESVAWVAERKNVLCMFFFLLAVTAYGWYARRPGIGRYLLMAILFAMGLMSKPMAISLPFVLLLLDYWPLGRLQFAGQAEGDVQSFDQASPDQASRDPESRDRVRHDESRARFEGSRLSVARLCLEKTPLFALSAGSAIITLIAQRAGGAILNSAAHAPLLRLENVVVCYGLYLEKAIWPSHLAALYPYPHVLAAWKVVAAAIFLLGVTFAVVTQREQRYLLVGWLWYLVTMMPMIGLVQVGNQAMADRYAYLPLIGPFIMTVWAVAEWASRRQVATKYMAAAGLAIIVGFSALTRAQIRYWHDDLSLWGHALAVTRTNYVAENNFAQALIKQGRSEEAIRHFRAASAIEPGDPVSELNLGIYAEEHGDWQQALGRYRMVLQLATDTELRASAYANLGTVYFALHDYVQAQQNFAAAARLKAVFPIALLDMGLIAQRNAQASRTATAGDWNRAAVYFAQFVAVTPSDVGYLLLARALHEAGRDEEAKVASQQALRMSTNIDQARQEAARLGGP